MGSKKTELWELAETVEDTAGKVDAILNWVRELEIRVSFGPKATRKWSGVNYEAPIKRWPQEASERTQEEARETYAASEDIAAILGKLAKVEREQVQLREMVGSLENALEKVNADIIELFKQSMKERGVAFAKTTEEPEEEPPGYTRYQVRAGTCTDKGEYGDAIILDNSPKGAAYCFYKRFLKAGLRSEPGLLICVKEEGQPELEFRKKHMDEWEERVSKQKTLAAAAYKADKKKGVSDAS